MRKSLLFRLFGLGKIPRRYRSLLQSEGIVLAEEGLACRVNYRNYRAPGKRFVHKHVAFPGSLVITEKRLAAFTPTRPLINIPRNDPRLSKLEISTPRTDRLLIGFRGEDFDSRTRGEISCTFHLSRAELFKDTLCAPSG